MVSTSSVCIMASSRQLGKNLDGCGESSVWLFNVIVSVVGQLC